MARNTRTTAEAKRQSKSWQANRLADAMGLLRSAAAELETVASQIKHDGGSQVDVRRIQADAAQARDLYTRALERGRRTAKAADWNLGDIELRFED